MPAIVTQFGLGSAFLLGLYDGTFTFKELAEQGDFGHGTFNAVEGEMIALDGRFYRVDFEGKVSLVSPDMQTPMATVTWFRADQIITLKTIKSYLSFQEKLTAQFSSRNIIYAIRVDGVFEQMRVRSEQAQSRPYQSLDMSLPRTQRQFLLDNTKGSLVGYFVPDIFREVVLPGFHFHYINDNRDAGGHVFDFTFNEAKVSLQSCRELKIRLSDMIEFDQMDLSKDFNHALDVAKRG